MLAVKNTHFFLASASPRRQQLLRQLGFDPVCMPVSLDERPLEGETPSSLVERLACQKAERCLQQLVDTGGHMAGEAVVVLGADTVIDLDGEVLGKPLNKPDGLAMLKRLSDREHVVLTGVCVLCARLSASSTVAQRHEVCVSTRVQFGPVSEEQAETYWESGEPAGKAGGYAIQGLGAQFVANLSGSYSNVVGLPLYETNRLLEKAGLSANHPT
jgi:septum formation protein